MAPWNNNGHAYGDFALDGRRFRPPLRDVKGRRIPFNSDPASAEYVAAIRAEERAKAKAQEGQLAVRRQAFARLGFEAAADRYLQELAALRPNSPRRGGNPRKSWEGDLFERLRPFFASKRLNQISADDVLAYQTDRLTKGKHPNTVNHEVRALMRLLKRAKLASRIRDDVKLLRFQREPREMLTPAEKQRVFETAATRKEWQTAYCAALLTANTSMRPVEIRRLKWEDLDPVSRLIFVRRSKTDAGERIIPLNDEAWSAIAALKRRADAMTVYAPENYIFFRQFPVLDATRPMSNWRSAWRSLRQAAAIEDKDLGREAMPKLARLRYYDLRHLFVTELCEAGVPEAVIRELAGHIDPEMTRHYSHPRMAARRSAVEVLSAVKAPAQPALPEARNVINRVITIDRVRGESS